MKKSAIKFTVFFITFIVALLVISNMMNVGNRDMTMEQEEATFPLVYMRFNHENINCLQGYRNEMKVNYQRDSVITINEERNLEIEIDKNEMKIDSLFFQVRSIDGESLIENSQIFGYVDTECTIQCYFSFTLLFEENK